MGQNIVCGNLKSRICSHANCIDLRFDISTILPELFSKLDDFAWQLIDRTLTRDQKEFVLHTFSGREVWRVFAQIHDGDSRQHLRAAMDEFLYFKMKESDEMMVHVQKMLQVVDKLRNHGKAVSEEELCDQLLRSLPSSYLELVKTLSNVFEEKYTWVYITHRLSREEIRKKSGSNDNGGQAFLMQSRGSGRPNRPTCSFCNRMGHVAEHCWSNPSSKSFRGNPTPRFQPTPRFNQNQNPLKPNTANHATHFSDDCEGMYMTHQETLSIASGKWILDSGVSSHYCGESSYFKNLRAIKDVPIKMTDNRVVMEM